MTLNYTLYYIQANHEARFSPYFKMKDKLSVKMSFDPCSSREEIMNVSKYQSTHWMVQRV